MAETITASDGTVYARASLVEDADGLWAQMGGALALVIPSASFEAKRKPDPVKVKAEAAARAREAAVQAEMRAMAEERLAAKGL